MALGRTRMAALIITAGLALAGCSDGDDSKPAAAASKPPVNCQNPDLSIADRAACGPGSGMTTAPIIPTPTFPAIPTPTNRPPGCDDPDVSMQYWVTLCGGEVSNHPGETGPAPGALMQLGQPAEVGAEASKGGGTLELTPTTAVYAPRKNLDTEPAKDNYVVVTIKERNPGAVATEAAYGGGWTYIAPDGEALTSRVAALYGAGFDSLGKPLQPGTFHWGETTWPIRADQRGGTLQYIDGTGVVYRWQLPAQDTGPQVEQVKKGLD